MEMPEQDYHNFSTSSSHRLPTISGTQAIRNAKRNAQPIPTSLPTLDAILGKSSSSRILSGGGIQRGVVTEVFGPPGVGKTTFALQAAVNTLRTLDNGVSVTWIDTSSQLVRSRLVDITSACRLPPGHDLPSSPPLAQGPETSLLEKRFNYLQVTSLPRLLTLFLHPTEKFPPPNTSLIVLDDLSNLILSSLPRTPRSTSTKVSQRTPGSIQDAALAKRALSRRFQVLSSFASALQKFAAARNVAILVTSKASINLKAGQRAVLRPALTSQQWDNYLSTRIVLLRDFWGDDLHTTQQGEDESSLHPTDFEKRSLRVAKVVKLGGKLVSTPEVGFVIEKGGLYEVKAPFRAQESSILPITTQPLHPLEDVMGPDTNEQDFADNDNTAEDERLGALSDDLMPEIPGKSKRKAIEIADSDDEAGERTDSDDEILLTVSRRARLAPITTSGGSEEVSIKESVFGAAKTDRGDEMSFQETQTEEITKDHEGNTGKEDEEDEMLLEIHEKYVTPLSQAAANMSEPLTPSEDGRDLP